VEDLFPELAPSGAEFVIFDGLDVLPPFNEDHESSPGLAVDVWRQAISGADALLFATPEYNSSIPGHLKNAVDWGSRPFDTAALRNKPSAVVGASTSMFGGVWAQAELRKVLGSAGARVVAGELSVPFAETAFDQDGALVDGQHTAALISVVVSLLEAADYRLSASREAEATASSV
jgi:chromate reductase